MHRGRRPGARGRDTGCPRSRRGADRESPARRAERRTCRPSSRAVRFHPAAAAA